MPYEVWQERPADPHDFEDHRDRGPNSCVARGRRGHPCARDVLYDAPFPVCVKHAAELLRYLHENLAQETILASALERLLSYDSGEHNRVMDLPDAGVPVVYYARVGNHIKIGYSSNLTRRMRGYPPDTEILATEPGTRELEKERHMEFNHQLRMGNEWFAPSLDLLMHIESLQAASKT